MPHLRRCELRAFAYALDSATGEYLPDACPSVGQFPKPGCRKTQIKRRKTMMTNRRVLINCARYAHCPALI
jgi:hypothetical protein